MAEQERRFVRFMQQLREGNTFGFLSLYFFTVSEAEEIANELRNNSTLECLSIPNCYAGRRKILPIITALKQNDLSRLNYLDLNDNRLEDEGCYVVCDFLRKNKTVQVVALRANRISGNGDHSGAKHIADLLMQNNTIIKMELGANKLGPEGAKLIDAALAKNKSVQHLDLSDNRFGPEGVFNLENVFLNNNTLTYLQLHHNNIGTAGAEQIAVFLCKNPTTSIEKVVLLSKFIRLVVLQGLLQHGNVEDVKDEFISKVFFQEDFFDKKIKTVREEWQKAKLNGQELVKVPQEVFEFQDAEGIKSYLKQALAEGLSSNKAVKMLMVGRARAGKTSLTNSLVNDKSGLTKDDDDRATVSVEIRPWKVDDVTISIWDFAGQEEYYMTHTFFLSRRCVVVLIVDLAAYKDFMNDVYYWVKAIQAHIPGVSFFLVGTHIDQLTPEEINKRCSEILISFQEEERRVVLALDKQLELMEESNNDNYAQIDLQEELEAKAEGKPVGKNVVYLDNVQMARIREQRDYRPSILHDKVYAVSSAQMEGIPELRKAIWTHSTNESVAIRLPKSYVSLLNKLQNFGNSFPHEPILRRDEIAEFIGPELMGKFENEDGVDAALELLHIVGQVLWYREQNQLKDRVFVSPRWVVDLTKALVRHDMFVTEHGNSGIIEKLPTPAHLKAHEFEEMKKKFREQAIFDLRFLGMLETWKDISAEHRLKLVSLLKQFDLIIPLPRKTVIKGRKKADQNFDFDECFIPLYLKESFHARNNNLKKTTSQSSNAVKSLRKSIANLVGLLERKVKLTDGTETEEMRADLGAVTGTTFENVDKHKVSWRYDLHEYFPEGLFFRLLVRCYTLGKVEYVAEDCLYSRIGKDVKVVIQEDRRNKHILLAASHSKDLQSVWPAFVLFATEFEDLLRTAYQGVTCQVVCIAADSRLRERILCTHDQHADMVPPIEYMHIVWGNISAVQVGILLRLRNIKSQVQNFTSEAEAQPKHVSEIHLIGKEAFSLLEKLLLNFCKINDLSIRNGRNFESYVTTLRLAFSNHKAKTVELNSEALKFDVFEDMGNVESETVLEELMGLLDEYKGFVQKNIHLNKEFVEKVVSLGERLLPDLTKKETELERMRRQNYAGSHLNSMVAEASLDFLKNRMNVAFDAVKTTNFIAADFEGIAGRDNNLPIKALKAGEKPDVKTDI